MRSFALLTLISSVVLAQPGSWVDDCGLEPPGSVPFVAVPRKTWEPLVTPSTPPVVSPMVYAPRFGGAPVTHVRGQGALAGKVIYLSPGHGFTWDVVNANWRTQRPTTNAIVEDLVSIETLSQFLVPMLLNAGARVVPVRELDLNTNLVIVDNAGPGYVEQGAGFSDSSALAWAPPSLPMNGSTEPFANAMANRLMTAAATNTASCTFTATIPVSGYYDVSVAYSQFSARIQDAHYVVRHAGGETHFRVNQQRHGGTWELLGKFYFRAGGTAQVVVQNDTVLGSGGSISNVSCDAVKFGGGMGVIDRGGGVSGRPHFEESARYQAQWAGAPASVWAPSANTPGDDRNNDVGTRSRFAAWFHETGEDAIYVAWHTNAFNASAVGTNTYVYGPNPPDGTLNFTGVDGGLQLANLVHGELVNDIKQDAGWNQPTWRDRGVNSAYFGELNPSNNGETPSILIEVAFHDAAADALHLKEPYFRYLATRAIAQGIIKFYAAKDGVAVRLPPEPPTHVAAVNQGNGEAVIRWRAPGTDSQNVRGQAATGYRLYSSDDGLAWDDGVDVTATNARVPIPASAAKYFRVSSLNAGGESFPSVVVGVRAPVAGKPLVLLVNGFDRFEAAIGQTETFAAKYALGDVLRIFVSKMNDGTAARITGESLDANQVGFDTAESDAVTSGDVPVSPYQLLTWFVGRGQQGGATLTSAERMVISDFRTRNLPVFFTGAATNDAALLTALNGVASATPGSNSVDGLGPLMGVTTLTLDDGTNGSFDTGVPPALTPSGAAISLGTYGNGANAAVGTPMQSVMFGFPFETLVGRTQRVDVMARVLAFLAPGASDGGVVQVDAGMTIDAGTGGGSGGGGGTTGGGGGATGGGGGATGGGATGGGSTGGGSGVGGGGGLAQGELCDTDLQCVSGLTCRLRPSDLTTRCLPFPVLAFEGGGCSASPQILLGVALILLARRRVGRR
ncbi:MAG: N-acetylmuramoyl-L-alanine amidase [Archangium sp.]